MCTDTETFISDMSEYCTDTYISNWDEGDCVMHDNFSYDDYTVNPIQSDVALVIQDTFYRPLDIDMKEFTKFDARQECAMSSVQDNGNCITSTARGLRMDEIAKADECANNPIGDTKRITDPYNVKDKACINPSDSYELFSKLYSVTQPLIVSGQLMALRANLAQYAMEACNNIQTLSNNTLQTTHLLQLVEDQFYTNDIYKKHQANQEINNQIMYGMYASNRYQNGYAIKFEFYKLMCIANYECNNM